MTFWVLSKEKNRLAILVAHTYIKSPEGSFVGHCNSLEMVMDAKVHRKMMMSLWVRILPWRKKKIVNKKKKKNNILFLFPLKKKKKKK